MDQDPIVPFSDGTTYHEDVLVPPYLMRHYWWAYVHPRAVKVFDRPWLVNLILLGNYKRLVQAAIDEFETRPPGRVLQLACVYGDLSLKLAKSVAGADGTLDVIDVLPIQLRNLKWKLPSRTPARLMRMDSTALDLPDQRYDQVLLFFLLHEQPEAVRQETITEALRVLKRDGTLIIVDYGKPRWWNPLRYLMPPFLAVLEPFALSLMKTPIETRLPDAMRVRQTSYFGGLYQKVVATRRP